MSTSNYGHSILIPADNNLTLQLRSATKHCHKAVENSSFMIHLFQGDVVKSSYVRYLWSLKRIYESIEGILNQNKQNPYIRLVNFPELYRTEAIRRDLNSWDPASEIKISRSLDEVCQMYTNYLESLSSFKPELIVAHAYVRYLGDLTGGRMLESILEKKLPKGSGLQFYKYELDDVKLMVHLYQSHLNQIGQLSTFVSEEIIAEAPLAFKYNELILNAISEDETLEKIPVQNQALDSHRASKAG